MNQADNIADNILASFANRAETLGMERSCPMQQLLYPCCCVTQYTQGQLQKLDAKHAAFDKPVMGLSDSVCTQWRMSCLGQLSRALVAHQLTMGQVSLAHPGPIWNCEDISRALQIKQAYRHFLGPFCAPILCMNRFQLPPSPLGPGPPASVNAGARLQGFTCSIASNHCRPVASITII